MEVHICRQSARKLEARESVLDCTVSARPSGAYLWDHASNVKQNLLSGLGWMHREQYLHNHNKHTSNRKRRPRRRRGGRKSRGGCVRGGDEYLSSIMRRPQAVPSPDLGHSTVRVSFRGRTLLEAAKERGDGWLEVRRHSGDSFSNHTSLSLLPCKVDGSPELQADFHGCVLVLRAKNEASRGSTCANRSFSFSPFS